MGNCSEMVNVVDAEAAESARNEAGVIVEAVLALEVVVLERFSCHSEKKQKAVGEC